MVWVHRDVIISASYWVRLANLCDRLKCLPGPGSLADQTPYVLSKLEAALRAIDDVIEKKSKANDNS